MKNKKWIFVIMLISIIFILIAYNFYSRPQGYSTVMEKLISNHIKTRKPIVIYNSIVIDDHHFVSYILEDPKGYQEVGYAHVRTNSNGKYELINIIKPDKTTEVARDITIYEFSRLKSEISQLITSDYTINTKVFIISNNPELLKIERIINKKEIQTEEITTNPSITFFDDLDEDNKVEYNFYNRNEEIIKGEDIDSIVELQLSSL